MPIPFTCPHCGCFTNVDDQYAGQTGPCASCGQSITIPAAGAGYSETVTPARSSMGPGSILAIVLVVLLVCGGLVVLLLPARETAREAARRSQCMNNLKQIALAMHNYHDRYKCFPAAVITDEDDVPLHSWRVAILPYLEQAPLFDLYNFDEPWDSPSNRTLGAARPNCYTCPSDANLGPEETNYVMIVGKGTVGGEPNEVVKFSDILDGTSNTIMAIEVAGAGICWMEPRDMTVDEAIAYITNPEANGQEHAHPGGVNAVFADGSVQFISETIDPQTLRNLLTRDDGQVVEFDF